MIDRKTYLTLPGDYKTLKSDFLGTLEASGKDVLVLTDCVTLKVGKTRFIISPLFAPIDQSESSQRHLPRRSSQR